MRVWWILGALLVGCGSEGVCGSLDPEACATTPGCEPIVGSPIVDDGAGVCIDYGASEAVGCQPAGQSCPPNVKTAGPDGDAGECWSFGNCVPPGWSDCTTVTATCP